jgi:sugar phosphate isomerase/epimerase
MTRRLAISRSCIAAAVLSLSGPIWAAAPVKPSENPVFFPFCIDWHDAKKRDFTQQAQMLKELGYSGVGHIWLDKVAERIQSLDAAGLKLYQITIAVDITPGKQAYDPRLKEVLALVKGRGVQFAMLINGAKPSDVASDERGVAVIREIAELDKTTDAQFLIYPHVDCWTERIEDCVRVAEKVNLPQVGVMFNVCHWLRVSKDRDYASRLKAAMPRLMAVSINGADERDDQPGWAKYIQPLGRGSLDMAKFLRTLHELGFKGPIGLQCYGIGGDTQEHLKESMEAWKKLKPAGY